MTARRSRQRHDISYLVIPWMIKNIRMKSKFLAGLVFLLSTVRSFSQECVIVEIGNSVSEITENMNSFTQKDGVQSDTLNVTYYYDGPEIRIISATSDNQGRSILLYYLRNKLIFTESNWYDPRTNRHLYRETTYHCQGRLFAWLKSETTFADSNSAEFKSLDRHLRVYSLNLLDQAEK